MSVLHFWSLLWYSGWQLRCCSVVAKVFLVVSILVFSEFAVR